MPHIITQNCCIDASCVAVCPVDAIHPRPDEPEFLTTDMVYIDLQNCIDCGACAHVCPVSAIYPEDDLPDRFSEYGQINDEYFSAHATSPYPPANGSTFNLSPTRARLRVAVVGAGPAGAYAAADLLARQDVDVEVDVYDRLLTPWGLVRSGVAPDHESTKSVTGQFEQVADDPRFRFRLGVTIGSDVSVEELGQHYHAVVYAVGASADKPLGIPGEQLPGSFAATDFVAWYNGHPDHADDGYDLTGHRAVIIGNGNVALDAARILLTDPDELASTDIADHALEAFRASRITEVVILGRRGPDQAAYTLPELRALAHLRGVAMSVEGADVALTEPLAQLCAGASADQEPRKRLIFRFQSAPTEILGEDRVRGIRFAATELETGVDGSVRFRQTAQTDDVEASLVLRATGLRGQPIPGLPFDEEVQRIPAEAGRVLSLPQRRRVPGVYVTGWIKRGATGMIDTNRHCARETVDSLLVDFHARHLDAPSIPVADLDAVLERRNVILIGLEGWRRIDASEKTAGATANRARRKYTKTSEQHSIAAPGGTVARRG